MKKKDVHELRHSSTYKNNQLLVQFYKLTFLFDCNLTIKYFSYANFNLKFLNL